MGIVFAPMEGVTGALYRQVHRQFYPGLEQYYTPFLSPTGDHRFTGRNLRELDLASCGQIPLVPQLLTKNAQDFLWAAKNLQELGFSEVNLNLGCPSSTVVPKGKGAGFLAHPAELERFFDDIFGRVALPVSVKTRLGMVSPEEFPALLELFNRYPICELIIHPRTREEFYRGAVHTESFAYAVEHSKIPLCYNGNLLSEADLSSAAKRFPSVKRWMVGRGLVARPSLFSEPPDREKLREFTEELCRVYRKSLSGTLPLLAKMKELWSFLLHGFAESERWGKALRKAQSWQEFYGLTQRIFNEAPLSEELLPFA